MTRPGFTITVTAHNAMTRKQGFTAAAASKLVALFVLAAVLAVAIHSSGAAENASKPITSKARDKISFSIQTPPKAGLKPGCTYAIERLRRNGKLVKPAPAMKLDARTGEFSWTPTESQVGTYEMTFLIRDAAGREVRTSRRFIVEAGQIASGRRKVALILREWSKAGTAAGNIGDFYDNRDDGHSKLNTTLFPQLDKIEYTAEQRRRRLHYGTQLQMMFNQVTLGNSSTALPAAAGGCNPRRCMSSARAIAVMYLQYRRNHLYVYPEHRDYDPGHNGRGGGYGDLFPGNTPYVITSQGSSGSDRSFMEAVAYTLAAFRPEVKQSLKRAGLLMPTVQMIFRMCNKGVQDDKAYLTGKAHPPVFSGGNIDVLAMVRMAHDITRESAPPMLQLTVVEEDIATPGRDFFDEFRSGKLFDTPCAIARVARSTRRDRRMVISAKGSYDVNRRPLKHHWVVLQGDPGLISIKPLNSDGSVVELKVRNHTRRPIRDGSLMESSRVDIGSFVHNGKYYSSPGFVSIFFLDNELRTYDHAGRILEVSYGHGDARIGSHTYQARGGDIKDYCGLIELICGTGDGLGARLLRGKFTDEEVTVLREAAGELRPVWNSMRQAEAKKDASKVYAVRKVFAELLTRRREGLKASVLVRVEDALNAVKSDVNLFFRNAEALGKLYKACRDRRRGQAYSKASSDLRKLKARVTPDTKADETEPFGADAERGGGVLTGYHRNLVQRLNIAILQSMVYPDLIDWRWRVNFVDQRIVTPKTWRDAYRYAPDGRLIGWTRFRGFRKERFTADGAVVLKKDSLGRALIAQSVKYTADRTAKAWSLKQQPGDLTHHYEYVSDKDMVGRIARTERRQHVAPASGAGVLGQ